MSSKNITDSELQQVRSPEPLTFTVLRVKNVVSKHELLFSEHPLTSPTL